MCYSLWYFISYDKTVVPNSLQPHGLYSPWNSPGQNTGVGSLSLRGNLPNPGTEPRSPALQADSLPVELPGKPSVADTAHQLAVRVLLRKLKSSFVFIRMLETKVRVDQEHFLLGEALWLGREPLMHLLRSLTRSRCLFLLADSDRSSS